MNFSDSEIVASILEEDGFGSTKDIKDADMILSIPVRSVIMQNYG